MKMDGKLQEEEVITHTLKTDKANNSQLKEAEEAIDNESIK